MVKSVLHHGVKVSALDSNRLFKRHKELPTFMENRFLIVLVVTISSAKLLVLWVLFY